MAAPDIPPATEVDEPTLDDGRPPPDTDAPTPISGSGPSATCTDAEPAETVQDLGEVRATDQPGAQHTGDCGLIVWATSDGALMLHQLDGGTTETLLDASIGARWPHQSGQDLVFVAGEPGQVVHYSLESGGFLTLAPSPHAQLRPKVSENLFAWEDERTGVAQIRVIERATGAELQVDPTSADQRFVAIDGGQIVWTDFRDDDENGVYDGDLTDRSDIWRRDANGKVSAAVAAESKQSFPDLSGDVLIWLDWRNVPKDENGHPRPEPKLGQFELWTLDLASGETDGQVFEQVWQGDWGGLPTIEGDLLAWVSFDKTSVRDLSGANLYSTSGTGPVLTSGGLLVAHGDRVEAHLLPAETP